MNETKNQRNSRLAKQKENQNQVRANETMDKTNSRLSKQKDYQKKYIKKL